MNLKVKTIKPIDEFDIIIGMTEDDARAYLTSHGIKVVRTMVKNGKLFLGTCDIRVDRVNLRIKDDKVYEFYRG